MADKATQDLQSWARGEVRAGIEANPVVVAPVHVSLTVSESPMKVHQARLVSLETLPSITADECARFVLGDAIGRGVLTRDEATKAAPSGADGLVLSGAVLHPLVGMIVAAARTRPWIGLHVPHMLCEGWSTVVVVRSRIADLPVGTRLRFPHRSSAPSAGPVAGGPGPEVSHTWRHLGFGMSGLEVLQVGPGIITLDAACNALAGLRTDLAGRRVVIDGARAVWHLAMLVSRLIDLKVAALAVRTPRFAAPDPRFAGAATVCYSQDAVWRIGELISFPQPAVDGTGVVLGGNPHSGKTLLQRDLTRLGARRGYSVWKVPGSPDGEGDWFYQLPPQTARELRQALPHTELFRHRRLAEVRSTMSSFRLVLVDVGGRPGSDVRDFLLTAGAAVWLAGPGEEPEKAFQEWDRLETGRSRVVARLHRVPGGASDEGDGGGPRLVTDPYLRLEGRLRDEQDRLLLLDFLYWYPLLDLACQNNLLEALRDPESRAGGYGLQPADWLRQKLVHEFDELEEAFLRGPEQVLNELGDLAYYFAQLLVSEPGICPAGRHPLAGVAGGYGLGLDVVAEAALQKYRRRVRHGKSHGTEYDLAERIVRRQDPLRVLPGFGRELAALGQLMRSLAGDR